MVDRAGLPTRPGGAPGAAEGQGRRLRIGILETGAPPEALQPRFGRYPAMFQRLLDDGYDYRTWNVAEGELPPGPEAADALLARDGRSWRRPIKR